MNSETLSKVEFAVQITDATCVNAVKQKLMEVGLKNNNVESIIDSENKECRLIIQTSKPWIDLQEAIESTGRRSVLVGFSDEAAVVMLDKGSVNVKGVIRICSITANNPGIVVDGVIDGLNPKEDHTVSIHEFGDISNGCNSLGEVYKNSRYAIKPNDQGRAIIRTIDKNLYVSELIGRSVAISSNVSKSISVFGVICRAAGIFQNWKRICACDGLNIWDERDRPLAGAGRRVQN